MRDEKDIAKPKYKVGEIVWVIKHKICRANYKLSSEKIIKCKILEWFPESKSYKIDGFYPYSKVMPSYSFRGEEDLFETKEAAKKYLEKWENK